MSLHHERWSDNGKAGVVRSDMDYRKSYTLRFVNKGVGLDLRPKK